MGVYKLFWDLYLLGGSYLAGGRSFDNICYQNYYNKVLAVLTEDGNTNVPIMYKEGTLSIAWTNEACYVYIYSGL